MSAHEETNSTIEPAAAPVIPAGEGAADTAADPSTVDRDGKGRFRNPVQPRIDELTRDKREAEREAAYWRQRAETREANEAKAAEAKASEKPTPDKFDDYGAYVEALTDWKSDQKIKANNETLKAESAKEREARERGERWQKRRASVSEKLTDFDEVVGAAAHVRINQFVSDALNESDREAELVYKIAQDPSIADRLNAMTPRQAALEIGRMESALQTVSAEPDPDEVPVEIKPEAKAPVRKTTTAPAPIKPIAKGGSTAVDLSRLKGDDYVKARAAQGAKWARR
jgi:hypothetical protein